MANIHTLPGTKFGTFTVIRRTKNERGNRAKFICLCDCGKEHVKFADELFTERYSKCQCENEHSQEVEVTTTVESIATVAVNEVTEAVDPIADVVTVATKTDAEAASAVVEEVPSNDNV